MKRVKKLWVALGALVLLSSCDPVAQMDALVSNQTDGSISLLLVGSSSDVPNELFSIEPGAQTKVQEGFDVANTYIEPNFSQYDSIYVKNSDGDILKVFTANTKGKNIYNISDFWVSRELRKWTFEFTYVITQSDIE